MKGGSLENHQNHPKFKHKSPIQAQKPNSSTKENKPLKKHASSYPPPKCPSSTPQNMALTHLKACRPHNKPKYSVHL